MNNTISTLRAGLAAALLCSLAACGGGGGGSSSGAGAPPVTTTAPAPTSTPISTTIAPTSYPAGSQQLAAYTLLNQDRVACGFGSLVQDARLDQAAQAHVSWLLVNNYIGHYENAGTPGYTGNAPEDRDIAAGYKFATTGVIGDEIINNINTTGASATMLLRGLLAVPYHLGGAMGSFVNLGIGYEDSTAAGTTTQYGARTLLNIDMGVPQGSGSQSLGASDVETYPCQGTTGAQWEMTQETPSPLPSRNLTTNPTGPAIGVMVADGQTITLTSATITNTATGAPVAIAALRTQANDPNPTEMSANYGYILPDAPLAPNTVYQVIVAGTNSGAPFSRTFTFTTGS